MTQTNIGDVSVVYNGVTLCLTNTTSRRLDEVHFDTQGVEELLEFLISLCGADLNRRHTFRVPLWATSGLDVTLRSGSRRFTAWPKNISVTGIFVHFPEEAGPYLYIGAEIEVRLEFEGEVQILPAIVRRYESQGCGLSFFDSSQGEDENPPPEFTRLLMDLQRKWMARLKEAKERSGQLRAFHGS